MEGSQTLEESQTSDNMDRRKTEMGRVREGEEKKKEDQRRESQMKEDPGWQTATEEESPQTHPNIVFSS